MCVSKGYIGSFGSTIQLIDPSFVPSFRFDWARRRCCWVSGRNPSRRSKNWNCIYGEWSCERPMPTRPASPSKATRTPPFSGWSTRSRGASAPSKPRAGCAKPKSGCTRAAKRSDSTTRSCRRVSTKSTRTAPTSATLRSPSTATWLQVWRTQLPLHLLLDESFKSLWRVFIELKVEISTNPRLNLTKETSTILLFDGSKWRAFSIDLNLKKKLDSDQTMGIS